MAHRAPRSNTAVNLFEETYFERSTSWSHHCAHVRPSTNHGRHIRRPLAFHGGKLPKLTNQVTVTVSIFFRPSTCHNFDRGILRRGAPLLHDHGVAGMLKGYRPRTGKTTKIVRRIAPSGLQLTVDNDLLVKAISKHSRHCPMHVNLTQWVSALSL